MIDNERFIAALARASLLDGKDGGIGTLSERSMHKTLKLYYEPREELHEVDVLGCVADIKNECGITEIQRGSFSYLIPKLRRFLPEHTVTVVHPVTAVKNMSWLDPMSGEVTKKRRCPGGKTVYDTAFEIYKIRDFLPSDNLTVKLVFLECDVYKRLDGYGRDKKNRATLIESMPRRIIDEITLSSKEDYRVFLPEGLGSEFTAADFKRAIKSRSRYSYYSIKLLEHFGIIAHTGERGRAFVYTRL